MLLTPMQAIVLGGGAGLAVFVLAALLLFWDVAPRRRPLDDRQEPEEMTPVPAEWAEHPEVDLALLADLRGRCGR